LNGTLMDHRAHALSGRLSPPPFDIGAGWAKSGFFTERRLGLWAFAVVLVYVIVIWQIIRAGMPIGVEGKDCVDFTWIWLSSKFALSSVLAQAYDYSVFSAARATLVGPPNCVLEHLDYPPTLLLFTYPLGSMRYSIAFAAWIWATLLLYLAAVYAIIPRPAAVIGSLTTVPVLFNFLLGHTGFLTAGLIGLALAFVERWPWLSGILLGLLTYKPQFGILFPLVLLASRNWRALLSATATSVTFGATAAIEFGYQVWPSFIGALIERASSLDQDQGLSVPLASVFGFLRSAGVNADISWTVQLTVTAIVAVTVCALWARPIDHSLKAAALCAGSLIASPHAISYDLCILSIAVAFLVKDGMSRGFLPGERAVMLICWAGLILMMGPIPAIICVVLFVLVVRRAVLCQTDAPRTAPGLPEPVVAAYRAPL
jgi:arabinofuranan 3-O-arabinosyltransferase